MTDETSWHSLPIEDVITKLKTNSTTGLTLQEAQARLLADGPNSLPAPNQKSLASIFIGQFMSPLIYLLLASTVVAYFIGEVRDALVILSVVVLNAVIGSFQEGRAEQSLKSLLLLSKIKARVRRGSQEVLIEARALVVGDLINLSSGDAVPSDARLIETSGLSSAEAALTGESIPVEKVATTLGAETPLTDRINMVYAGTSITAGRGLAVITTTAAHNEIGKIAHLATTTEQPKTQLELRIKKFGRLLVFCALGMLILVVAVGLLRGIPFSQIFLIAISQMVSLVPEGLPVAITIALSVGVQRLARKKTIVRRLQAVETLGSISVICSDKTGTLTKNEMTVTTVYLPSQNRTLMVGGVGYSPTGVFSEKNLTVDAPKIVDLNPLLEACVLCNDAELIEPGEKNKPWSILGDPTEGALLTLAAKAHVPIKEVRGRLPRTNEIAFDSTTKMMATEHKFENQNIIYIKGAPEAVLALCKTVLIEGQIQTLTTERRADLKSAAASMAQSALRLLGFAVIKNATLNPIEGFAALKEAATFLGVVGELDPPREGVTASVLECRRAGIKPVIVTGDFKPTAVAIGKALGIYDEKDLAIDGQELDQLSDADLLKKLGLISVFARVHPAQKLRIVEAYQTCGDVVAMTGDGVNDAPALARANVGIAMGITGTEVAKDAAKIVITDDNFSTIVTAISEGRLVYENIRKLILFLFVTSLDEVIVLFLALLFGYPPPLAAVQILWINLVSEGTLTVNLIMDPAEGGEMRRPPVSSSQSLLDEALVKRMPFLILPSVVATLGWFLYRTSVGADPLQVQTETFTVLVVCQWFNVLNCRSALKSVFTFDILKNRWLVGGLIISNLLQAAVIYWKPLNDFFHTVPIGVAHFFAIGAVASLCLWVEETRKLYVRLTVKSLLKLRQV